MLLLGDRPSVLTTFAPIHQATKQLAVLSLRQNVAARRMMSFSSTASSAPSSRSSSSSSDKALKRVVHRLAATLPHHGASGGSRSAVPLNSSCVHGNRAAFSTVALSTRVADASSNRSSSSHSSVPKRFASTHRQLRKCEWCHSCTPLALSLQRLTAPFVVIVCTQQPQRMASPPSFSGC